MLNDLLKNINKIYMAYGVTDFRKQTNSLCNIVRSVYDKDPCDSSAYIFCNKKKNSIRVLCYDKNGFVLAQKTLLNTDKMKFQWPRNKEELKSITKEQLSWLLSGLKIQQEKQFKEINPDNIIY